MVKHLSLLLAGALAATVVAPSHPAPAPIVAPAAFQGLPPLPDSIPSQLGWVRVHRVVDLQCGGQDAYGCFEYQSRTLSVRDSMDLAVAWQTLEHERVHMIFFDADVHFAQRGLEDHLADVIGSARVTERLATGR